MARPLMIIAGAGLAAAALAACQTPSTTQMQTGAANAPTETARDQAFQRDREAILAMTGDYHVTFHFEEVVALAEGYELIPDEDSGGNETVFVVEDEGDVIRLQHVLVVGPEDSPIVVKHWRQDWVYEPEQILEYDGLNRWATRTLSDEERAGAWSQTVYQVDDSPRYAAVAPWRHDAGVSTWESPWSWRPLPRRDATTRDDYHVVNAVNRHTITPWGWSHEQDNEKLVIHADGSTTALVREIGVNSYRAIDDFPTGPAETYWAATEAFWAVVRERWDGMEAEAATIDILGAEPDDPIYEPILAFVDQLADGAITTEEAVERFDAVLAERVFMNAPDRPEQTLAALDAAEDY